MVLGVALALATNASLLDMFRYEGQGEAREIAFLSQFGHGPRDDLLGCVLLGAAAALGSQFWHDLVYRLRDARNLAKDVPQTARDQIAETLRVAERDGGL